MIGLKKFVDFLWADGDLILADAYLGHPIALYE